MDKGRIRKKKRIAAYAKQDSVPLTTPSTPGGSFFHYSTKTIVTKPSWSVNLEHGSRIGQETDSRDLSKLNLTSEPLLSLA